MTKKRYYKPTYYKSTSWNAYENEFDLDLWILDTDLEIYKKIGLACSPSDFSILTGAYVSNDDKRTTYYPTVLLNEKNKILTITPDGESIYLKQNLPHFSLRITALAPYRLQNNYFKNEDEITLIEYGEYLEDITSKKDDDILMHKLHNKELEKTGKYYTIPSSSYNQKNRKYKYRHIPEYIYNNKKYALVEANLFIPDGKTKEHKFPNGRIVKDGELVWVEVKTLKWIYDEKNKTLISLNTLISNILLERENIRYPRSSLLQDFSSNYLKYEIRASKPALLNSLYSTTRVKIEKIKKNIQKVSTYNKNVQNNYYILVEKISKKLEKLLLEELKDNIKSIKEISKIIALNLLKNINILNIENNELLFEELIESVANNIIKNIKSTTEIVKTENQIITQEIIDDEISLPEQETISISETESKIDNTEEIEEIEEIDEIEENLLQSQTTNEETEIISLKITTLNEHLQTILELFSYAIKNFKNIKNYKAEVNATPKEEHISSNIYFHIEAPTTDIEKIHDYFSNIIKTFNISNSNLEVKQLYKKPETNI